MKEIILCKYGELVLKGANKSSFESRLTKELRRRAWLYGAFEVHHAQSTIYIEPLNDEADLDGMYESARDVFGIVGVTRAAVAETNIDDICREAINRRAAARVRRARDAPALRGDRFPGCRVHDGKARTGTGSRPF